VSTKLFVGSLPWKVNDNSLRKTFEKFGNVISAKVVMDKQSGRSRGFGFVEMSSDEEAQKAIEMLNNSSFMDRNIVVNEAKPQGERERGRGGPSRERGGFRERRPGGRR